jgi:hypothetical protein
MSWYIHFNDSAMTVLSKIARTPPASKGCKRKLVLQKQRTLGFVEVTLSQHNPAQSFIAKSDFAKIEASILCIPCVSAYATWLISEHLVATNEQVSECFDQVCLAVGPCDETGYIPCSCILSLPLLQKAILEGCVHSLLNWDAIARNMRTRASPQCIVDVLSQDDVHTAHDAVEAHTKSSREVASNHDCIICLNYTPCYRWSNCSHQHEGIALVCLFCRNAILVLQQTKSNKPYINKHVVKTPCVICRSPGILKKHTR